MEYDLEYQFDELGLSVNKGKNLVGFFDGTATITFDDDGDWWITGISLSKRKNAPHEESDGEFVFRGTAEDSPLFHLLSDALEKTRSAQIASDVADELSNQEPLTYGNFVHANSAGRTFA